MGIRDRLARWIGGSEYAGYKAAGSAFNELVLLYTNDGWFPAEQFRQLEGVGSLGSGSKTKIAWAYQVASIVYACAHANATAAASLPWQIQERVREGGRRRWVPAQAPYPDIEQLIDAPFGGVESFPLAWGMNDLVKVCSLHRYLEGNAYLRMIRVDRNQRLRRFEFWDPCNVEIEINGRRLPKKYKYGQGEYDPTEVVHMVEVDPGSAARGLAPLESILASARVDRIAIERIKANLLNRIAPGLIMSIKGAAGLTEDQRDEYKQYLTDNYQKATKDGTPLVVGEDAKVLATPDMSHQIDYDQTRAMVRRDTIAVFGTPPPVIGDYEQATLQNFAQAIRVWWTSRLLPLLAQIAHAINRQAIAPIYGPDVRIWYDIADSDVGLILLLAKAEAAQALVDLGYPANAAAEKVGLSMQKFDELDIANVKFTIAGRSDAGAEQGNE